MNNEIEKEIERITNRIQDFRNEKAKLEPENMEDVAGIDYQIEELQKELDINKRALRVFEEQMLKMNKPAKKEVGNVVFYTFNGENGLQKQACVFYKDGSVMNTNVEGGEEALNELIEEEVKNVGKDSKEVLNKLVNNRYYNLSGKEFEERFQEFVYKEKEEKAKVKKASEIAIVPQKTTEIATASENTTAISVIDPKVKEIEEIGKRIGSIDTKKVQPKETKKSPIIVPVTKVSNDNNEKHDDLISKNSNKKSGIKVVPVKVSGNNNYKDKNVNNKKPLRTPVIPVVEKNSDKEPENIITNKEDVEKTPIIPVAPAKVEGKDKSEGKKDTAGNKEQPIVPVIPVVKPKEENKETAKKEEPKKEEPKKEEAKKEEAKKEEAKKETKKKDNLLKRIWKKLVALVLAISVFVTGCTALGKKDKDKGNNSTNKPSSSQINKENEIGNEYQHMLNGTENALQYVIMKHQGDIIFGFNRDFANNYIEAGKNIKAGLTWDEAVALNIGLNEYTPEQLGIMLNGTVLSTKDIKDDFKNAQLQIIGAYVISDRDHPVNLASFLTNDNDKAIVQQAENRYYDFIEASEDEKETKEKELYEYLDKYLVKQEETLQPGISHSELRDQHDSVDVSLVLIREATRLVSDNEHKVDLASGLCNIAYSKLEEAAILSQNHPLDTRLELHEDYKEAAINDLKHSKDYPLNDESRDLSQLDKFKERVNQETEVETHTITTSHTTTVTKQETTKTDNREEAVDKSSEEDVKKAEEEANKKIEEENKKAEEEAKKQAEEEEKHLQEEADKEKEENKKEIEDDEKDLEENLDDVNKGNKPATEEEIGHGTEFDDEDKKPGTDDTLGDDIKDITTDGEGAVDEDTPLPDPNEYAQQQNQTTSTYQTQEVFEIPRDISVEEQNSASTNDQNFFEGEEEYVEETGKAYVKTR